MLANDGAGRASYEYPQPHCSAMSSEFRSSFLKLKLAWLLSEINFHSRLRITTSNSFNWQTQTRLFYLLNWKVRLLNFINLVELVSRLLPRSAPTKVLPINHIIISMWWQNIYFRTIHFGFFCASRRSFWGFFDKMRMDVVINKRNIIRLGRLRRITFIIRVHLITFECLLVNVIEF